MDILLHSSIPLVTKGLFSDMPHCETFIVITNSNSNDKVTGDINIYVYTDIYNYVEPISTACLPPLSSD